MIIKLPQASPEACTRVAQLEAVPVRWTTLDPCMGGSGLGSSWVQHDDADESGKTRVGIKWNAVCGLAISFAISAGFWAGVGLVISRIV